jgi:hypothetical protein
VGAGKATRLPPSERARSFARTSPPGLSGLKRLNLAATSCPSQIPKTPLPKPHPAPPRFASKALSLLYKSLREGGFEGLGGFVNADAHW